MSTPPVTEKQHYAPRLYLRPFANPATGELQILDLELRKIVSPRGPGGLCRESFFYGVRTGQYDENSQIVEHYLRDLETALAHDLPPIIEKLRDRNAHIEPVEKYVIAILMSLIYVRGPALREWINDMQETSLKQVTRVMAEMPGFNRYMDEVAAETGKVLTDEMRAKLREEIERGEDKLIFNNWMHLQFMSDQIKPVARTFHAQHWNVGVSGDPSVTFVTSCDPVTTIVPPYKGFYPPTFQRRTHYFPLTPDICIEAVRPFNLGKRLRRKTLFAAQREAVHRTNLMTASRARRYVYARDREPLEALLQALPSPAANGGSHP
jgi:hypothetical protein